MSTRYSRAELGAILDARRRSDSLEGQGDGAYFDFWFRITPDLLYEIMGARIVHVEPILTRHAVRT